jgi:putative transposase
MPRLARVVVPGLPHHVTQRGNRRQRTFFSAADFALYKRLLREWSEHWKVEVWAYCLMPNHLHLIVRPPSQEALTRTLAETHRRYSRYVNWRENWRGFLWQGRFGSFPMDEIHLHRAVRYVLLNPVVAGLASSAAAWPHSSAAAHLGLRGDEVVDLAALDRRISDWRGLLAELVSTPDADEIELHQRTGRPLGEPAFVDALEERLGRRLRRRRPGPQPKPPV